MKEAGSKPEIEVFDSGDIALAKVLIEQGVLDTPAMFQIVTGIRYGFESSPATMMYARNLLPPDAQWAGFGIGRVWPVDAQVRIAVLGEALFVVVDDGVVAGAHDGPFRIRYFRKYCNRGSRAGWYHALRYAGKKFACVWLPAASF